MYSISIVVVLLYILCIPVLSTDTSTELYAGIFRGWGNCIEKLVFPATPYCTDILYQNAASAVCPHQDLSGVYTAVQGFSRESYN